MLLCAIFEFWHVKYSIVENERWKMNETVTNNYNLNDLALCWIIIRKVECQNNHISIFIWWICFVETKNMRNKENQSFIFDCIRPWCKLKFVIRLLQLQQRQNIEIHTHTFRLNGCDIVEFYIRIICVLLVATVSWYIDMQQ